MRTIAVITFCLGLFGLSACKDDRGAEVFTMAQAFDFTIPAGLNTQITHFFLDPSVVSTFQAQLDASGRTVDDIEGVYPKFSELSTVFRDENIDFIARVEVRILDPFDPDFNREVFYSDPVPPNTNTLIRPFPGLANVKDLVSGQVYALEVRLVFWRIPTQSLDMRLYYELSARI